MGASEDEPLIDEATGLRGLARVKVPTRWAEWKKGSATTRGEIIREVLFSNEYCIIYATEEGEIGYEGNDDVREESLTAMEAQEMFEEVNLVFPRNDSTTKRERARARSLVIQCMAHALTARSVNDQSDYFLSAKSYLRARGLEALQGAHLAAAASAVLISALLLLPVVLPSALHEEARRFFMAGSCGALGAFISVSQRFRGIDFGRYASRRRAREEGWLRILLGAMFGVVLVLLQAAELLLGIADGLYQIAAFALAAGFSERLIPELLGSVEKRIVPITEVRDATR